MRRKAISELESLSLSLDEAFDITANMSIAEIDDELREMGIDPQQLGSLNLSQVLAAKDESQNPAYVYVSDEPLNQECKGREEVILSILKLRHLTRWQRYGEALEFARQATLLAPDYWRAWISYSGLLILLGQLDEGEAIYQRVLKDFSDNPKAVAAAFHGCAGVKEIRGGLNLSEEELLEVSHLYGKALEFDESRVNTRACLIINSALAQQADKSHQLLQDSQQCEGFFDAIKFELEERESRGAKMYKVIQSFPMWFRNFLCGVGLSDPGNMGTNAAY
jgi:tetratricopeptide (TPR) repeat protein